MEVERPAHLTDEESDYETKPRRRKRVKKDSLTEIDASSQPLPAASSPSATTNSSSAPEGAQKLQPSYETLVTRIRRQKAHTKWLRAQLDAMDDYQNTSDQLKQAKYDLDKTKEDLKLVKADLVEVKATCATLQKEIHQLSSSTLLAQVQLAGISDDNLKLRQALLAAQQDTGEKPIDSYSNKATLTVLRSSQHG